MLPMYDNSITSLCNPFIGTLNTFSSTQRKQSTYFNLLTLALSLVLNHIKETLCVLNSSNFEHLRRSPDSASMVHVPTASSLQLLRLLQTGTLPELETNTSPVHITTSHGLCDRPFFLQLLHNSHQAGYPKVQSAGNCIEQNILHAICPTSTCHPTNSTRALKG